MLLLTKTVHVLALGLWFGTVVFFTLVVGLVMFHTFEHLGERPVGPERPEWLPQDLDKDKGTRLFGIAIGPLFPWFFTVQGVCGLLAVATALSFPSEQSPTIQRIRTWVLIAALGTVVAGWPLAQKIGALRLERYSPDPAVAQAAKEAFGPWHSYSLLLTFGTMILVAVAMALAAQLPSGEPRPVAVEAEKRE